MNPLASYIWQKLETPLTFGELTDHLCNTFNVEEKVCIQDTLDFITEFIEREIIHENAD